MAWEQRNGKLYYYRKIRRGRQVISEYIGAGLSAELICKIDQSERKQREFENHEWLRHKLQIQELDNELDQVSKTIQSLLRAMLLVSNYHPHKGQWRQVRYGK